MSSDVENIETSGIYTDLIRKFGREGHEVYIIYPRERRTRRVTEVNVHKSIHLLGVRTLNLTKTNVVEKGIGQVLLELQFKRALKKYWRHIKFDLILYSTPPITFTNVIKYVKKANPNAISYLMLKDIFPQNAVDIGMLRKGGIAGILYEIFRTKEMELYSISDYIGCMSPANVKFLLEHNPEIDTEKVEIAPNSYEVPKEEVGSADLLGIRRKYGLPIDKPVFIYGGNMGKPQGIQFLIECMNAVKDRDDCHIVIIGSGTEYPKLKNWYEMVTPKSVSLFQLIPKEDYDILTKSCDIGMIFLDYRFTIPNFPSRLLPYLMNRKPIIAVTDPNSDVGPIAEFNDYGFWCPSNSVAAFVDVINKMLASDFKKMGENGYEFYLNNYTIGHTYNAIMQHFK